MNIQRLSVFRFLILAIAVSAAAASHAAPQARAAAATGATNGTLIAQSTFVMPANKSEGKDPFFPESDRPYANSGPITKATPKSNNAESYLKLNGLSGPPEKRLAMINGRTLAVTEQSEVSTPVGKLVIRLIEIKTESVVVETGNGRKELPLKAN